MTTNITWPAPRVIPTTARVQTPHAKKLKDAEWAYRESQDKARRKAMLALSAPGWGQS